MEPDLSFWLLKLRAAQRNGLYLNSIASGSDPSRLPLEVAAVLEQRGLVRVALLGRIRSKAVLTTSGRQLADEVHQRTRADLRACDTKGTDRPRGHLRLV